MRPVDDFFMFSWFGFSLPSFLQCFDTVGLVSVTASGPTKHPSTLADQHRGSNDDNINDKH